MSTPISSPPASPSNSPTPLNTWLSHSLHSLTCITVSLSGGALAGYSLRNEKIKASGGSTKNLDPLINRLPGKWGVRCAAFACVYEAGKGVSAAGREGLRDYLPKEIGGGEGREGKGGTNTEGHVMKIVDCVFGAGMASLLGTTIGNEMIEDRGKLLRIQVCVWGGQGGRGREGDLLWEAVGRRPPL